MHSASFKFLLRTTHTCFKHLNQHKRNMATVASEENVCIIRPNSTESKSASKGSVRFPILITCEHASNKLPSDYHWPKEDIGLSEQHWAIDLGAEDFAKEFAALTNSPALLSTVSRLLLDANRPPDAETLCRTIADGKPVYLNKDITEEEKQKRINRFHAPYYRQLKKLGEEYKPELILSIHSFTPLYEQKKREVEIGVLFNRHEKPAQELTKFFKSCGHDARVNAPWSGLDGFMHAASTLETDTSKGIMLEFRQDLVVQPEWRKKVAQQLYQFLTTHWNF